jgi:regulator of protease activity HflC (stomatin/prohibitin superfamily)
MSSPLEVAVGAAVEIFFIAIALAVVYRVWGWFFAVPKRQVVPALQRGVLLRDGTVEKVLDPGAYWITPRRRLVLCDSRPVPFQVPAQELLTSDGLPARISLGGEYRIIEPAFFVTQSSDAFGALYLVLRHALRVAVGELSSANFLDGQTQITVRLKELIVPKAAQLGIEMTQLDMYECVPVGWLRST